jgi:hypothetical protein
VQIPKASPVQVEAGDEVRFGDVVTIFCPPEVLWDAMMTAGPPSGRAGPPASGRMPPPSSNKPGGR